VSARTRPTTIHPEMLTRTRQRAVLDWLIANGLRHHLPASWPITVQGGWITVHAYPVRRDRGYDHPLTGHGITKDGRFYLRRRVLRERVPLAPFLERAAQQATITGRLVPLPSGGDA
jgi:hypothetical protein